MAQTTRYIAISAVLALIMLGAFFAWDSHRITSMEQEARTLVTQTVQSVLESGDSTLLMSRATPDAAIALENMEAIRGFGKLIELQPIQDDISTGTFLDSDSSQAVLRMRGHFARGTVNVAAGMKYQNGQWEFTSFVVEPGNRAQ